MSADTPEPMALDLPTIRTNDSPWRLRFEVTDDNGEAHDFTGHTIVIEVRRWPGAPGAALLRATSAATTGTRIVRDATGFDVIFGPAQLAALPWPASPGPEAPYQAWYDILVTTPAGDQNVWWEGRAPIKRGVTIA